MISALFVLEDFHVQQVFLYHLSEAISIYPSMVHDSHSQVFHGQDINSFRPISDKMFDIGHFFAFTILQ